MNPLYYEPMSLLKAALGEKIRFIVVVIQVRFVLTWPRIFKL